MAYYLYAELPIFLEKNLFIDRFSWNLKQKSRGRLQCVDTKTGVTLAWPPQTVGLCFYLTQGGLANTECQSSKKTFFHFLYHTAKKEF